MQGLAGLNHALHLVTAVLWIGGLAFIIMTLTPAIRGKFSHESSKAFFQEIRNRYYRMGGAFFAIMLVTGVLNVHFSLVDLEQAPRTWIIVLALKLALVTGFGSLFFLNILYKSNPPESGETAIPFARVSMILGLLIVISAALLRHIR